jgi:hypothetical protein
MATGRFSLLRVVSRKRLLLRVSLSIIWGLAVPQVKGQEPLKLTESLRTLELGTVSVDVLRERQGWLEMLVGYVNGELLAADPSDAVIILGPRLPTELWPRTPYYGEVPGGMLEGRKTPIPRFYYFAYYPSFLWGRGQRFRGGVDRPEMLSSLTRRLDGTVYEFSTPSDLEHAIQKMLTQLQPRADSLRLHPSTKLVADQF